ncbi:MAG: NADH-quinone oxidoreductase subunit NuoE [uncultured Sulfurovum sp.]|uniref:NADH-quinone oxidoreductase subunit NuoE n=2 Tax=uncultured Sulfurovum sp. TaxID=269237 RepID=A0A6S6S624_9BACT|nr:MAG: NADH-quinone oxidoreductase subunit NuoE [uncultured Sulfurovum sp.]
MLEVASQIIICLILAALLGWIIGYLMGKATCSEKNKCNHGGDNSHELHIDNKDKKSTATVASNTEEEILTQPILLTEAREGRKDNLQLIKGVGTVLEGVLNETGIYHFDQIANLSPEEVSWLDHSMSFPGRITREDWIAQAKDLAEGKETEYSQRVERGEVASSKKSD